MSQPVQVQEPGPLSYLYANAFEAMIAFAAVVGALSFWGHPDTLAQSAVGKQFGIWDDAWNAMYFAGGVLVLLGMMRRGRFYVLRRVPHPKVEVCGLIFLGTAIIVNLIALFADVGFTVSIFTLAAVGVACGMRVHALLHRAATVTMEVVSREAA